MDRCLNEWLYVFMDRRMCRWMDEWMRGWMDVWKDGWMTDKRSTSDLS